MIESWDMLKPDTDWYWYVDKQEQKLCISLNAQMCFVSPYSVNNICQAKADKQAFSIADLDHYTELAECLQQAGLSLSGAELSQILLNATAAIAFHKPLAAKSWYFQVQANQGIYHRLASMHNDCDAGLFLVLFQESLTATCMLLSPSMQLDIGKTLKQFSLIKVMSDRLQPYLPQIQQKKSA